MEHRRKLTVQDMTKVEDLVSAFTNKTLGTASPKNTCFYLSYALHLHLKNNGIENSLRNGSCENINHFWLNLDGSEEIIVDPTFGQFDFAKNIPPIYIGQKPSCYSENPEFNFEDESYDNKILNILLLNFRYKNIFIEEGKITESDLDSLLQINVKAAIIINTEIENHPNIDTIKYKRYSDYFSGIKELLCIHADKSKLDEFAKIQGFSDLVTTVLRH